MTLTEKEEKITKLMAAKVMAQVKLNKVNLEMGQAIRAEFATIDAAKREEYKPQYEPLEAEIKSLNEQIKTVCE